MALTWIKVHLSNWFGRLWLSSNNGILFVCYVTKTWRNERDVTNKKSIFGNTAPRKLGLDLTWSLWKVKIRINILSTYLEVTSAYNGLGMLNLAQSRINQGEGDPTILLFWNILYTTLCLCFWLDLLNQGINTTSKQLPLNINQKHSLSLELFREFQPNLKKGQFCERRSFFCNFRFNKVYGTWSN